MDLLSGINIEVSIDDNSLKTETFSLLIRFMGYRNQLRMNHWQTKSYAEHKLADDITASLSAFIDALGETTLGAFGRPQISETSTRITDMSMAPTKSILDLMEAEIKSLLAEYKETQHEGAIDLLSAFSSELPKFKYLATLE